MESPKPILLLFITVILSVLAILIFTSLPTAFQKPSSASNLIDENTATLVSAKPRNKTISYFVRKEETLAKIARSFDISEDTIRQENNLTSDELYEGQILRILPVTGVSHIVLERDTVQSIAQMYQSTTQKITDFPFNEFADPVLHILTPGQILIVPDGIR